MKRPVLSTKMPTTAQKVALSEHSKPELYRRAKTRMVQRQNQKRPGAIARPVEADAERLFHELQVHQVELELQNAELQEARNRTETLLEKFTDLYDFAPVGYFSLSPDGAMLQVNLTGAQLVGIDRSLLLGQMFGRLICVNQRQEFNSFLKRVFVEMSTQTKEFDLIAKGLPPKAINIEAKRSADGRECRVVVVDITDRRQAELRVKISENRYRRVFEATHDGILLVDPQTRRIIDANPSMTQLLGYPHDQLVGKELYEIGLLKDETASQVMFRKLRQKHEVRYEDLPLESQRGQHLEVEVVANLYQENGIQVIQCNIRDVTQRKQAEAMLRGNEALFSDLIDQAPVGVYVVDNRLRIQKINPKARPLFTNIHPLIGRELSVILSQIWPVTIAEEIVGRFQHALLTGQPYFSPEFSEQRQDLGKTEIYEWQLQRVTLPAGQPGVVCFFNNITERKKAEATHQRLAVLAASNRKLEREITRRKKVEQTLLKSEQHQKGLLEQSCLLQEQLSDLSRQVLRVQEDERKRISRELHDVIAQTLTGINIRLTVLKNEAGSSTKTLDRNIAATQRLVEKSVEIVHRFASELRPAVLDDLGLIPALHSHLKTFTARTGIRTRLVAFAEVDQLDAAKRTTLYRVAQEALTNVAKHAQATQVEVNISQKPDGILMEIIDDGRSFPALRLMQTRGRKGLGLLGMRERLEMIGGRFAVNSSPGQGTTIIAQIPWAKTSQRAGDSN